jgi:inositol polyphosphate 5-phosphatase INPP5E
VVDNKSMLAEESSREADPQSSLSVTAVTWNLFASLPPMDSLLHLARAASFCPQPDLILLATQECQRSLLLSLFCEGKQEWEAMLPEVFTEHTLVAVQVMRGLHTAVLVRKKLRSYFTVAEERRVKTGAGGLMGNKGAISLTFRLLGEQFQVINCHLDSQHTATAARNRTISRILQELVAEDPPGEVIFLGDFNYRIEMALEDYQRLHAGKRRNTEEEAKYSAFLKREQLTNQQSLQMSFLKRFEEGSITFPPTYKLATERNEYSRVRIPGWTDRIFSLKKQGEGSMKRESYSCEYNVLGCDHRPVIARYRKPLSKGISSFGNEYSRRGEGQSACALI